MRIRFIDRPEFHHREEYKATLDYLMTIGSELDGIQSIYQFGTVSSPGISDLDLIFVFKPGKKSNFSFLDGLPVKHRYFLTHNVVGITESQLKESFHYSFWLNINHLWGQKLNLPDSNKLRSEEILALKRQTSLEYLVTVNLSLSTQFTYGIFKLRSILQQIKGLRYDLEFLNIQEGRLYEMISECYGWINTWFENGPTEANFAKWLVEFHQEYQTFAQEQINEHKIYSKNWQDIRVSRHIQLVQKDQYSITHRGLVLPHLFKFTGKKYFNVLSRFNSFECHLPIVQKTDDPILDERMRYFESLYNYNKEHLPQFEAMITPFVAYQLATKAT